MTTTRDPASLHPIAASHAGVGRLDGELGAERMRSMVRTALSQFLRFLPVGGSAAMLSLATYAALIAIGLPTAPAKAISFTLGATFSYIVNRSFTFRSRKGGAHNLPIFAALYAGTLVLNVSVNELVLAGLGRSTIGLGVAWFIATSCSSMTNFLGMKFLVFRGAERKPPSMDSVPGDSRHSADPITNKFNGTCFASTEEALGCSV